MQNLKLFNLFLFLSESYLNSECYSHHLVKEFLFRIDLLKVSFLTLILEFFFKDLEFLNKYLPFSTSPIEVHWIAALLTSHFMWYHSISVMIFDELHSKLKFIRLILTQLHLAIPLYHLNKSLILKATMLQELICLVTTKEQTKILTKVYLTVLLSSDDFICFLFTNQPCIHSLFQGRTFSISITRFLHLSICFDQPIIHFHFISFSWFVVLHQVIKLS